MNPKSKMVSIEYFNADTGEFIKNGQVSSQKFFEMISKFRSKMAAKSYERYRKARVMRDFTNSKIWDFIVKSYEEHNLFIPV